MLCTEKQSTGLGTYPAISKNAVALFHQDVFDEDGVQNSQHRLPAIIKPKPIEIHSQSIFMVSWSKSSLLCLWPEPRHKGFGPSDKTAGRMRLELVYYIVKEEKGNDSDKHGQHKHF